MAPFTPWHAIWYSGATAMALHHLRHSLTVAFRVDATSTADPRQHCTAPQTRRLRHVFGISGFGDMIWHKRSAWRATRMFSQRTSDCSLGSSSVFRPVMVCMARPKSGTAACVLNCSWCWGWGCVGVVQLIFRYTNLWFRTSWRSVTASTDFCDYDDSTAPLSTGSALMQTLLLWASCCCLRRWKPHVVRCLFCSPFKRSAVGLF